MGTEADSASTPAALQYGLLAVVIVAYAGLFVAGFVAVFLAMSRIDSLLVQPATGGNDAVSLGAFLLVQLAYVAVVLRITTSGTARQEAADKWATFSGEWK